MATPKLVLLPHLQRWDNSTNVLQIRLLIMPRGSPLDPLLPGAPSFAKAHFKFDVHVQSGVATLPTLGGTPLTTIMPNTQAKSEAVFNALATQFNIDPNPPPGGGTPASTSVLKHLPGSYQATSSYAPGRSDLVFTDNTYACAMKAAPSKPTVPPPSNGMIPWGKVIAAVLRNSAIGKAAGMIYSFDISVDPPTLLEKGGYIYLTLSSTSDGSGLIAQNGLKIYGTRIPALAESRDIFSPVLFPVATTIPSLDYDTVFEEVENYNDGWAKIVHCSQPQQLDPLNETADGTRPAIEMGIRLGWDDEQVTIWMNRQLDATQAALDCPIGVVGYRIDTRLKGTSAWTSLVPAAGELGIGNVDLGNFEGELGVATHPVQLDAKTTGDFWLPTYFTSWYGQNLITLDATKYQLDTKADVPQRPGVIGTPPDIKMTYGNSYDFRVRLMDHTGGGPLISGSPIVPGPSPIASFPFRRWIRPGAPKVVDSPNAPTPPTSIEIKRPVLGYPAVVCTGAYPNAVDLLIADIPEAQSADRHPGLPDPDVVKLQITVEVEGLVQDPITTDKQYMPVLTTFRGFPADPNQSAVINISWQDVAEVTELPKPASGNLVLPTARNVRVLFAATCRDDPQLKYLGAQDVSTGPSVSVSLRQESSDERGIFLDDLSSNRIKALFLQPQAINSSTLLASQQLAGNGNQLPVDNPTAVAAALSLNNSGLTFRSKPGERVVFGCASSLRHVVGPDNASIRFATSDELALHWIVVIELVIRRDWSWDGFGDGLIVTRDSTEVGRFTQNKNVAKEALVNPQRDHTRFIFFDSNEPKPTGPFPTTLNPKYSISCSFAGSPNSDPPLSLALTLPVTTPPTQVPKVLSAGIAMTPYERDTVSYSYSNQRAKVLWIELDAPPADPNDSYFARVLRSVPDPLLSSTGLNLAETADPPLAIDPETIRSITPQQSDDSAGLDAMQPLIPCDTTAAEPAPRHYQLPLPPGLSASSPELFGFFTYEIRVWSPCDIVEPNGNLVDSSRPFRTAFTTRRSPAPASTTFARCPPHHRRSSRECPLCDLSAQRGLYLSHALQYVDTAVRSSQTA